jgi:hypothetical protein
MRPLRANPPSPPDRALPREPHPAWSAATERHCAREISADEFWERLGL